MLPRGDLLSLSAFGHTGFTGTMLVCDPEYGLVVVLLTNRVLLSQDNTGIKGVRRRVLNAVASAVQD
jgi:CubicO group peptidase (beta-lactamase class C family)